MPPTTAISPASTCLQLKVRGQGLAGNVRGCGGSQGSQCVCLCGCAVVRGLSEVALCKEKRDLAFVPLCICFSLEGNSYS